MFDWIFSGGCGDRHGWVCNDMNSPLLAFAHVEPCMISGLGNSMREPSFHHKDKRPAIFAVDPNQLYMR